MNEPGEAEAEPAARASWAGKLGKWAAALKPTPATVPPESEAAQKGCKSLEPQQQAANSKLGGGPSIMHAKAGQKIQDTRVHAKCLTHQKHAIAGLLR